MYGVGGRDKNSVVFLFPQWQMLNLSVHEGVISVLVQQVY